MLKQITLPLTFVAFGLSGPAMAQDAGQSGEVAQPAPRASAALIALGQINADIVELNRIADYQAELIALTQEDVVAARRARRASASCATRPLVRELCTVLPVGFPEALVNAPEAVE